MSSNAKRRTVRKAQTETEHWARKHNLVAGQYNTMVAAAEILAKRLDAITDQGKTLGLPATKPEEVAPMLLQAGQEEVHYWRSAMQAIAALCDRAFSTDEEGCRTLLRHISEIANEKIKS